MTPDPNQATSSFFLLILPHMRAERWPWSDRDHQQQGHLDVGQQAVLDALIWAYEVLKLLHLARHHFSCECLAPKALFSQNSSGFIDGMFVSKGIQPHMYV